MENITKSNTLYWIVFFLLHQGLSTTQDSGCANRSSRWRDLGGDFCYIIEVNDTATWIDAEYQCFKEGASLASFHSTEEVDRVADFVNDDSMRLHIGLRRNNNGYYEWSDKSPVDFTIWFPGEPNYSSYNYEECVEMYVQSGMWNDIDCNREFGYVCSSPKYQPRAEETKACPSTSDLWVDLGGDNCYIIENNNRVTRSGALQSCTVEGGSLASFHSVGEVSAVLQRARDYNVEYHIGIQQRSDGTYEWSDGSAVDFTYWGVTVNVNSLDSDVANDIKEKEETCAQMNSHDGRWSPAYCDELSPYICSTPKVSVCGADIVALSGVLHTPNYPQHYGPGEKCVWNIIAPKNHRIVLQFQDFEIESSFKCAKDYVQVLQGDNETDSEANKFCGSVTPEDIYSSGNILSVVFKSDFSNEAAGFYATFEADTCGGATYADAGVLTSSNYPGNYRKNDNCTWKITVPENHQIVLEFLMFNLEGGSNCRHDFVEVRDGHKSDSPVLGKFCGKNIPPLLRSSTNQVAVTFVTDDFNEREGFILTFQKDVIRLASLESILQEISDAFLREKAKNAKEKAVSRLF